MVEHSIRNRAAVRSNRIIGFLRYRLVLGGRRDLQPSEAEEERFAVSEDNTREDSTRLRGDFAVPTLFNGNFDATPDSDTFAHKTVSKEFAGWLFHNSATSSLINPVSNLVDWREISALVTRNNDQPSYLEKLGINSLASNYQSNTSHVSGH